MKTIFLLFVFLFSGGNYEVGISQSIREVSVGNSYGKQVLLLQEAVGNHILRHTLLHDMHSKTVQIGREEKDFEKEGWVREERRVWRTFYCCAGCGHSICGKNSRTATGKDAHKDGGIAVDFRRIPKYSIVEVEGKTLLADDQFGAKQRNRDLQKGITHIDIRVKGHPHEEVARMGAGFINVVIWRKIK